MKSVFFKCSGKLKATVMTMVLGVMMLMSFSADAQNYVETQEAVNRLNQAIEQVQLSDYNWTTPGPSTGKAIFHPAKLEQFYLHSLIRYIKKTDDVSYSLTKAPNAFQERFPDQMNWLPQWRQEIDLLLRG